MRNYLNSSSLRTRLILLIIFASIPAILFIINFANEERNIAIARSREESLQLIKLTATYQEEWLEGAHQLLIALGHMQPVYNLDSNDCNELFSHIHKKYPFYANIFAATPEGDLFCSAVPMDTSINSADLAWFKRTTSTRNFSIGDYQTGRITNVPVIVAAYPIYDNEGNLRVITCVSLDLMWLDKLTEHMNISDKESLLVIDRNGYVLARYPHPEKWEGKSFLDAEIVKIMLSQHEGTAQAYDIDNIERFYTFTTIKNRGLNTGIFLAKGTPTSEIYGDINKRLTRYIVLIFIINFIILTIIWFGTKTFVLRKMDSLLDVANQLGKGNLSIRTGLSHNNKYDDNEIGELARTFDKMAESLQERDIQRKNAEEIIHNSEKHYKSLSKKYKSLFENMLNGFAYCKMIFDDNNIPQDFVYINVNSAFEKLTGLNNVIGKKVTEIMPNIKNSNPELFEIYGRVSTTGIPEKFETYIDNLDNTESHLDNLDNKESHLGNLDNRETNLDTIGWLDISVYSPEKGYFVAIFDNITERKHTNDMLKKSEALLEETQHLTKVGGWEYDIMNKKITWTSEVYNIYDVQKDYDINNIDKNIDLYYSTDKPIIKQAFYDVVNNGRPYDLELRFTSAKGKHLWIRTIGKPIIENNKIVRIIGNIIDITDIKMVENALRDSEEKFRALVENILDIVSRFDDQYRYLYVSPAITYFLGRNPEDFIGKNHRELGFPEKSAELLESSIRKVFDTGKSHQSELEIDTIFGTRYFDWRVFPEFNEENKVRTVVALSRDITERKDAEKKLKIAYENLEHLNRELEQFTYISYHDLQEPLRTICGFAELLESNYKGKLGLDADEFIGYITTGARRMQQMINDILALSRIGTKGKEFVPTNIEKILRIVFENLHSLIEKNNAIITYDSMPTIMVDDSQIIQLFQNLIDNAIKFRRDEIPKIHISCKRKNGDFLFSVKDNGIGIDKNQFKKLFIIFQRLHSREKYPGTGIGLAICKKIVERHGGIIWVESDVGVGSTFFFTIPIGYVNNNETTTNTTGMSTKTARKKTRKTKTC